MKIFKYIILILFLSGLSEVYGQRIIEGKIIDESLLGFPGANIYNTNYTSLGQANFDGYFKINIPLDVDKLIITSVGYEHSTISLPKECDYIEFILLEDGVYHYNARKVDRVRKERFDKLTQLHSLAVDNGVFINKNICYKRNFEPYKPELDKIEKELKIRRKLNRNYFKNLKLGDTIRVPFSGNYKYDGTDRTTLFVWASFTDESVFDCVIQGVLKDKNKHRGRFNLTYEVLNCDNCKYEYPIYEGKIMKVGEEFIINMREYKVLIE